MLDRPCGEQLHPICQLPGVTLSSLNSTITLDTRLKLAVFCEKVERPKDTQYNAKFP